MLRSVDDNPPRVLVAEDDPLTRMAAVDTLVRAGFEVIAVMRAEDAFGLLGRHRGVSVVVTDVEMPGKMDGVALAEAIRNQWPKVGLVVVSGRVNPKRLPLGARFLQKPYPPGRLVQEVCDVLSPGRAAMA